ncbi:hypothetical protein [Lapidilactobacillus bayanensis]|uniref:hypothetical protein n=1 Tax=Lapidilactobacillus bayanensis TaxID=2485998 RepID=UPI000F7B7845|nr:hypothetical protein [Lapidilactobacillus bayanensis]
MKIDKAFESLFKELESISTEYIVIRNGVQAGTIKGAILKDHEIQTIPGIKILDGDELKTDDQILVADSIQPLPGPNGENNGYLIRYLTQRDIANQEKRVGISVGTINGDAVVSSGSNNTINFKSTDLSTIKELLDSKSEISQEEKEELTQLIETIINNNMPVSKGSFGKFKSIFDKYSDVALTVRAFIIKWLSTKN